MKIHLIHINLFIFSEFGCGTQWHHFQNLQSNRIRMNLLNLEFLVAEPDRSRQHPMVAEPSCVKINLINSFPANLISDLDIWLRNPMTLFF